MAADFTTTTKDPRSWRVADVGIAAALLAGAVVGWWLSATMSMSSMSMAAFLLAWVVMMAAMMFPAIAPVVRLYARAAARGAVAPLPLFVVGYMVVWAASGLPAYFAWRGLAEPLDAGVSWVGRLAGLVFVVAAAYQLTPLKRACLRHCRSPMSLFIRASGNPARPTVAVRLGAVHGGYCLGCCWALMAVLVAVGTMHLGWMVALTVVIFIEKVLPGGDGFATLAAAVFGVVGLVLFLDPSTMTTFT